ncbi:hypothetical protein GF373_04815 [bacterium]|nr:hypothetical protein [bacterium]
MIRLLRFSLFFFVLVLCVSSHAAFSQEDVNWWQFDKNVIKELFESNLLEEADRIKAASSPADLKFLLKKMNLLTRAGCTNEVHPLLSTIKQHPDSNSIDIHSQKLISNFFIRRKTWDLAARWMALFPRAEYGWAYLLVKHWMKSGKPHEEIDDWLAERSEDYPDFWVKERVRFRSQIGTAKELLEQFEKEARAHPTDGEKAQFWVAAAFCAQPPPAMEWVGDICRPNSALDAKALADQLFSHQKFQPAIPLYEHALTMELTEKEVQKRMMMSQVMIGEEEIRKRFAFDTKHHLAKAYKEVGEIDRAQAVVEELAQASKDDPNFFNNIALFAGGTQRASGARVVEHTIKEKEEENKESPQYWLGRASYYAGRKEHEDAVEAFNKALELSPIETQQRFKGGNIRSRAFTAYFNYLKRSGHKEEALALIWSEMKAVPTNTPTAERAIWALRELEEANLNVITHDNPALWDYLYKKETWDYNEERLLRILLKKTPQEKRRAVWDQLEAYVMEADPSKAYVFADVLRYMAYPARSVRLYKSVRERSKDDSLLRDIPFYLFDAYLKMGDWQKAEAVFPQALDHLSPREVSSWYAKIATLAAKQGAMDDAHRLWLKKMNLDLTDTRGLEGFMQHAGKARLLKYYKKQAEEYPDATVLRDLIEKLQRM